MPARILGSQIVHQNPGRYVAWPMVARMPDGALLVVFSGDRDGHVCPFGKTFLMRSADDGSTWSVPELVNDTPLDDRDAGLCVGADGTLVVSWFCTWRHPDDPSLTPQWRAHLKKIPDGQVARWTQDGAMDDGLTRRGHWVRRSVDGGRTWEEPIAVPVTAPHGPNLLSDGRLVFVGNDGYRRADRSSALAVAVSADTGCSWEVAARVSMFPDLPPSDSDGRRYLGEPHVVEVAPGHLLAMARHEEQPYVEGRPTGRLWRFASTDGGLSWSAPQETEILGKPPHLLRLRDGRLVVTYGYRHAPYGQRACLSADGGLTWDYDNEIVLRNDGPDADLGYPATVECGNGDLLSVYYQRHRPDEKPCLMATRWKV
jgi:sialidase-1